MEGRQGTAGSQNKPVTSSNVGHCPGHGRHGLQIQLTGVSVAFPSRNGGRDEVRARFNTA